MAISISLPSVWTHITRLVHDHLRCIEHPHQQRNLNYNLKKHWNMNLILPEKLPCCVKAYQRIQKARHATLHATPRHTMMKVEKQEAQSSKEGKEIATVMHTLGDEIAPVMHTLGARSFCS